MADNETLTATPYAVHVPDTYSEQEKREGASWELGAGHYEFGFEVNGARFPLARLKGGGVQKRLNAAKARQDGQQSQQPGSSGQPSGVQVTQTQAPSSTGPQAAAQGTGDPSTTA